MTREEAIIQLRLGPGINEDVSEKYNDAVNIAIEALERESSEVPINRQDAIEAVRLESAKYLLIRLRSGREFRLTCSADEICTHKIDGSLCEFKWKDGTGDCPLWLDITQIEAIIEEK